METFLLSTLVLKKHELSPRRIKLSLRKSWVSEVPNQLMGGRFGLPCPAVGLSMNYMMDRKAKLWSVVGRLKGCRAIDHIAHPLTYSGFSATIKPTDEPTTPTFYRKMNIPIRTSLTNYAVEVKYCHKVLDESLGRCESFDFRLIVPLVSTGSPDPVEELIFHDKIDHLSLKGYQVNSYLKLQVEICFNNNMSVKLIVLKSGTYPVTGFEPSLVVRELLHLPHVPEFGVLAPPDWLQLSEREWCLELIPELVQYFETQEQFEFVALSKRHLVGSERNLPNLVSSLRKLLRMKLDHLKALHITVSEKLLLSLPPHEQNNHPMATCLIGALRQAEQISSILANENADQDLLFSACAERLSSVFPCHRGWWKAIARELPPHISSQQPKLENNHFSDLLVYIRTVLVSRAHWARWCSKVDQIVKWCERNRGKRYQNLTPQTKEQDYVHLGSTGRQDLAHLFVPSCRIPYIERLTQSFFYDNNKLVFHDDWVMGDYEQYESWLEMVDESHCVLKDDRELNIRFSGQHYVDFRVTPLRDLSIQTLFNYKELRIPFVGFSSISKVETGLRQGGVKWRPQTNVDFGQNYLLALLRSRQKGLALWSMPLQYSKTEGRLTHLCDLLSETQMAAVARDDAYYTKKIHDPNRVFPLAYFEAERLVLFAQFSILDDCPRQESPVDVGVRLLSFSENSDRKFTLSELTRFHSHGLSREELEHSATRIGWDRQRHESSHFYFRWNEICGKKVGLWVQSWLRYSMYLFHGRKFVNLGSRSQHIKVTNDKTTSLMECRLGGYQPHIGISNVQSISSAGVQLQNWIYKLVI